jgi:hypothetical protein
MAGCSEREGGVMDTEQLERIKTRLIVLLEKRCDCILSIRGATECWRCREISQLRALISEAKK